MFKELDPILHSQLRLAVMSLLISVKEAEFTYVEMIKSLIASQPLEAEEITDGFSEPEIKSIGSMIKLINNEIKEKNGI